MGGSGQYLSMSSVSFGVLTPKTRSLCDSIDLWVCSDGVNWFWWICKCCGAV